MKKFTVSYGYDPKTSQYIAEIPELDLSDFGSTIEEAKNHLQAGLDLYFQEVFSSEKSHV